jgi:ABC-type spermidine/putrescine transport system permease subunit II
MLPNRSRTSVLVFLLPPLLLYGAAVLFPILQSLFLSFFSWNGISDMEFVGLDNYVRMFVADDIFWRAFLNALLYLAICLVLQLGGALVVASLVASLSRGRELIKTLYLLPAIISTVAIAFLFVRIYSIDPVGLLNQLLHWIGLGILERPWLSDVNTVLAAVSAPEGWRFTGLYMLIIYAALIAVPKELEEAARPGRRFALDPVHQDPLPVHPAGLDHHHHHGHHLRSARLRHPLPDDQRRAGTVLRTADHVHVQNSLHQHRLRLRQHHLRLHRRRVPRRRRPHPVPAQAEVRVMITQAAPASPPCHRSAPPGSLPPPS